MSNLQHWQTKIQDKRKQTPRRDFVMEICSWYNLSIYKNNGFVSQYPEINGLIIQDEKNYQISRDLITGNTRNDSDSFWGNFSSLRKDFLFPHNIYWGDCDNSIFSYNTGRSKNIYLSFESFFVENILYSSCIKDGSTNVISSIVVGDCSQNIFQSTGVYKSSDVFYSYGIFESYDIWFSTNLVGCSHCINCSNLSNTSYSIDNIQYSKIDYELKRSTYLKNKQGFNRLYNSLQRKLGNLGSTESSGNLNIKSSSCANGFYSYRINNGNNTLFAGGTEGNENYYDVASAGSPTGSNYFAVLGAGGGDQYYCSFMIVGGSEIYYSMLCESCSFCLGCIGLKNKSYCILNKQYSKEEWYQKVDEIFAQMEADGTLGEFFPATMNPFYFNDTAAYLIDPSFTKEEVTAAGYLWRDEPIKVDIPANAEIVKVEELEKYEGWRHPEGNEGSSIDRNGLDSSSFQSSEGQQRHIDPSIMKKIIQDPQGNVYRIVPMEYEFLMKHGLPLPRKHWLDRMKENFRITL